MANLPETPDYAVGVYQLETSDPVLGGPGGIANRQSEQLGNRTAWLKAKIDAFLDGTAAVFKATKLATARTLSVSGAASGSASFDGSANTNIALTLADSGAVAGTYPKVTVNAKGIVTGGAALVADDIPANLALIGTPSAPTAAPGTNTVQLANTAFVQAALAALVASSPAALDTLNELAAALGNDPNYAATMTNVLAGKQPLDATLTALAALATAADKLIYATGADAFGTTPFTVLARTLLAAADEAAMRAVLQTAHRQDAPAINLLSDSGRFAGRIDPLLHSLATPWANHSFLSAYNGATFAEAGKYISNNTTYGGLSGELNQTVIDLLAAMGRQPDHTRYGVEFYVTAITQGVGVAVPIEGADGVTRYLVTANLSRNFTGPSGDVTWIAWVRVVSGSAHIGAAAYFNGVAAQAGAVLPFDQWTHVRETVYSPMGYNNAVPYLCATAGSVIQVACQAVFAGRVHIDKHTAPIPSINELSN